jgi:hypothetical protein
MQTQLGAPSYGSGPQQAYPSGPQPVYGSGPQQAYGSGPQPVYGSGPQQAYGSGPHASFPDHNPSNPGLVPLGGMYPSLPPPPPAARRSSSGALFGAVAVVAVLGILGGVLYVKKGSTAGTDSADAGSLAVTAPVDAGKVAVAVPDEDAGEAPVASAPPPDAGPAHTPVATTPVANLPPKPFVIDPHEQECRQAEAAATRDNLPEARSHYAHCEGLSKGIARSAIEAAEGRRRPPPPPPPPAYTPPPPPPPPPPPLLPPGARCRGRNCPR